MSIFKKDEVVTKVDEKKEFRANKGASVLDAFSRLMEEKYNLKEEEDVDKKELRNYHELLNKGEAFTGVFVSSEAGGDYVYYEGDYKIILSNEMMASYGLIDRVSDKIMLLGEELELKVVSISDKVNENGKYEVYVKISGKAAGTYKADVKGKAIRELKNALEAGEKPVVWGRITGVRESDLFVDICDLGILGTLHVSHWQASYTNSLIGLAKEGDCMRFEVIRTLPHKPGKEQAFNLSRRKLAGDMWEKAQLADLEVGEQIVVTCRSVPEGKSYWWGTSERLPGLDIVGDYTEQYVRNRTIFPQIEYVCKVKKVEKVKFGGNVSYRVSVRPMKVCKHCLDAQSKLRLLHGIKDKVEE